MPIVSSVRHMHVKLAHCSNLRKARSHLASVQAMPMSKVTLLNLISEQLLGELTFAMNKPHLATARVDKKNTATAELEAHATGTVKLEHEWAKVTKVVHPLFETMELNATLFLQRMCIKVP